MVIMNEKGEKKCMYTMKGFGVLARFHLIGVSPYACIYIYLYLFLSTVELG